MRKRIANVAALLGALALAGALLAGAAALLDGARTAHAQESGGEQQAGAEGQAEDGGVRGQDDVDLFCADGGTTRSVRAGSIQTVSCEVSNDTGYNIRLSVSRTGGVQEVSRSLGSRRSNGTRPVTVRVRVNSAGSVTIRAEDHQDWDEDTINFTTTIPPVVPPPDPTVPPPAPTPTPTITISRSQSSITEGQSVTFTLTASAAPSSALKVKVSVTQSGSFISGATPSEVQIPNGGTSASFTVRTSDDGVDEPNGTITASIVSQPGAGYAVGATSSVDVIVNDNDRPTIRISRSQSSITEGQSVTFTLTASPAPYANLSVGVSVRQSGSFIRGATPSEVQIPQGGTSASFIVRTSDDSVIERNGSITARVLSDSNARYDVGSPSFAKVTVNNNDYPTVTIAAGTSPIAEGTTAQFTLTASAAPPSAIEVNVWVTQSGTFISGTPPKSVTIPANGTTATLSVPTLKDKVNEANGYVRASVRAGTNYAVGSTLPVSVSVRDTPYVSIAAGPSITEGANATFTITAAGAPLSNMTVQVSVTESRTGGETYIKGTAPSSVTIPASSAHQSTATLTVPTKDDSTDEPNGLITASIVANAGAAYELGSAFRASVNVQDNDVKLATPTGLTVTPLPQRKARLSWAMISGAPKYHVEVKGGGKSKVFILTHNLNPQVTYDIALDSVLNGKGLADANAYRFRVKAIYDDDTSDASDSYVDSDYSSVVEIRDTPITSINGDSSGRTDGKGQAVVSWSAVPGATAYTLRWRKLPDYEHGYVGSVLHTVHHSDDSWRLSHPMHDAEWSTEKNIATRQRTVADLELGEIYAFQITYEIGGGEGFSAREAYVWPSGGFPVGIKRVATFPFVGHWPNKEYQYSICADTFPSSKRAQWQTLIDSAFEQWESSTRDLVQVRRSLDCVVNASPVSMLESMKNNVNEVFMYNASSINNVPHHAAYLPQAYEFLGCLEVTACAIRLYHDGKWDPSSASASTQLVNGDVDIVINMDKVNRYSVTIPADTRLDACAGGSRSHYLYELMVHESGHAVGIMGFLHQNNALHYTLNEHQSHSTLVTESVMAYSKNNPYFGYKCSPYPFDIMAMYALYQTVN